MYSEKFYSQSDMSRKLIFIRKFILPYVPDIIVTTQDIQQLGHFELYLMDFPFLDSGLKGCAPMCVEARVPWQVFAYLLKICNPGWLGIHNSPSSTSLA